MLIKKQTTSHVLVFDCEKIQLFTNVFSSILQVEHFGKFGVIYYDINQIITTAVMTLSKHFDTHGRIKEVQYEIFRSLMYWMTVQYDSMGRVVKRELKIGPYANTTQYRYDYDGDGQLSGVKVNILCSETGILDPVLSQKCQLCLI